MRKKKKILEFTESINKDKFSKRSNKRISIKWNTLILEA